MRKYRLIREDDENEPEWVATYQLGTTEYDDELEDNSSTEVYLHAVDFEHAAGLDDLPQFFQNGTAQAFFQRQLIQRAAVNLFRLGHTASPI